MSLTITIREPKLTEVRQLHQILESEGSPASRRRAEAVLFHTAGLDAIQIAAALGAHVNTIRADLHAFERDGVSGVQAPGRRGIPRRLTDSQEKAIQRVADQAPSQMGLPWSRWSLARLRDYLLRCRMVKAISREHLRRVLKKGACACAASRKRSKATIPAGQRFWPVSAGSGGICLPRESCFSLM